MVRRALSFFWMLLPLQAFALGLGDIRVDSALNEPLDARIELHSLNPQEVQDVRVLLADKEAFKKAGLERPYLLNNLRFKVGIDARGEGFIRVSTRANVKEPYLNFLLEVTWRGGALQREYVVLLDPPTYRVEQVPVQPGADAAPAKGATSVSRQLPEIYRVRPAETLWVIAEKVRPEQIHTVEQVMMALQRQNPEAFLDNNVNRLKSGAILEVPDSAEVERMGSAEAKSEFKRQTQAWMEKRAQSMPPVAPVVQEQRTDELPAEQQAQAEPEPSVAAAQEPVEEQARLRILEPVDRAVVEEALTSTEGGPDQQMERLRTVIEASRQELESVREINRELDQLRATLETEIGALRQSLEERDAVIQELVKRMEQEDAAAAALAQAQANIEADTLSTTPPVTDEAEAGAIESSLAGTDSLTQDTADDEGSSFWVTGLLTVVILVMSLVAFFLWWSLYRGRSSKEESVLYNRVELPEVAITKESYDGLYRKLEQQEIEERERLEAEKSSQQPPEDQTDVLLTDEFFDEFEEQSSDSVETSEITTEAKPDVSAILTEADVYLIYRQYAKAESLVQECLQSHPQEPRLMAKLLEIYASQKAKAQFVAYLDEVADPLQRAAPDIWQRVKDLGSALVPEHPLFSLGGSTLVEDEEFDSGLSLQDPEIASIDIPAIDEQLQDRDDVGAPDSLDLELDLDDDDRGPGR
jgi:pilus assembly protein FimV